MAARRRGLGFWLGLFGLGLVGALWLAPALALRFALAPFAARAGGVAEVEGVWPALPFGVRARHLHVASEGRVLDLDDLRAVWTPWRTRVDARVADGTLLFRGEGLRADSGFLRLQGVALESLEPLLATPLALRGKADGIWRFGAQASIEGSVSRGAIVLRRAGSFELPFAQLVLSAARESPTAGWDVRFVDVQGPPLSASASGTIGADGALALSGQVRQLEEPVLSLFPLLRLPTGPLPLALAVEGSVSAPRLVASGAATAPPAGR
jgi:hypothetical protein